MSSESVKIFTPTVTEDCLTIINYLRENPAMINLKSTNKAVKQRIIDVLCGASFALNLGMCVVDKNNILIVKK